MDLWTQSLGIAGALAAGVLIGIERGWTQRSAQAGTRVAGIRTFSLIGLASGIAGSLAGQGALLAGGAIVAGIAAIIGLGYYRSLANSADATTAVAALVTCATGFLAGFGAIGLALAAAAATVLVLALREELHGLVDRLHSHDVKALARYAVIALAFLPFLPHRPMGPYGAWNPAQLWWIIILVTGFSFAAYVANRLFGSRHGTIATAIIGGAYSSTAVTQALAQRLGSTDQPGAEAAGIALASATMYLRVILLVAVLAGRILAPFAVIVAPALIVAGIAGAWLYRRAPSGDHLSPPGNPIALLPALGFVAFIAAAAVVVRWAEGRFGDQGIALLLFFMGALDVDASIVTAGGLPAATISAELAAVAIAGTIIANMAVKIAVTIAYARRMGLVAASALLASTITLAISVGAAWMRMH
jgi:uncharacterized membrane protein (DUF4010 family)